MRRRRPTRTRQTSLVFERRGGRRKGAGRPPKGERAGVPHLQRARLRSRQPVHVTVRVGAGLPSLRRSATWRVVREAFRAAADRNGLRIVEFSVQSNHVHILAEPLNTRALSRGMQGLLVRLARRLNRHWERRGTVFPDRYHVEKLTTPTQVRNALAYVLNNVRKHGRAKAAPGWVDPYSTAPWFPSYRDAPAQRARDRPAAESRSWLLRVGWKARGGFRTDYVPGRG